MVNNPQDEVFSKFFKLSSQERKVLELRCQGFDYKTIGERLFVTVSTVKQYMSRIYVKLGLDFLSRTERIKTLFETYCPQLKRFEESPRLIDEGKNEVLDDVVVYDTPEPVIPSYALAMVEEDEYPLVDMSLGSKKSLIVNPKPPRYELLILFIGIVLGVCLSILVVIFIFQPENIIIPFISQATATIPASIPLSSDTIIPSHTPEIPTQTPAIIQQVVVVTATQPPVTKTPTLTPLPQPITLFSDNFEQGLSNAWSVTSGNPIVVNGELTSDQNTWLKIGDDSWTDYTIQFGAKTAKCWYSDSWNAVGIRVQDTSNMIAFKWASCENELNIVKNGIWSTVPNSHVSKGNYGIVQIIISITVQGGQFTFDINGERVSSLFNSDYMQGGVALRVGAETQIDNIKITTIQK